MKTQKVVVRLTGGENPVVVDAEDARKALLAVHAVRSPIRQEIIGQLENVATMTIDQLSEILRIPKGLLPHQMRPLERTGLVLVLPGEEYCLNQDRLSQVNFLIRDLFKA